MSTLSRFALIPAVLLAAAPVALAGPAEQLAGLIQESTASGQPVMTFFTGARAMPNQTLDRATIQRALAIAKVPLKGPLAQVLTHTTRIVKNGDRLAIARNRSSVVKLGETGFARIGREVEFRVRGGAMTAASGRDRSHMTGADNGTGFVKVDKLDGIEVSEDGSSFYDMGDLYAFTRQKRPTIKFYAGPAIFGRWTEVSFDPPKPKPAAPAPAAPAVTASADAVVAPKYGLAALPMRAGPAAAHALLARLPEGTKLKVLSKASHPFWKVETGGTVGFVHSDHLKTGGVGITGNLNGQ